MSATEKAGKMEKRRLGRTELYAGPVGLGAYQIGKGVAESEATLLLNAALDAGLDVIDTAACYGRSEELLGKSVSHRRDEFVLLTKVGYRTDDDFTKDGVAASATHSLRLLKSDHVDVLFLHSCPLETLKEGAAIEGLRIARDRGYTRYVGYSGDGDAARFAIESGCFDVVQLSLNVADQIAADELLPRAVERGVGVIAKRSLAHAAWTHSQRPENRFAAAYWDRLGTLGYDFLREPMGVSLALRFTLTVPGVGVALVGTAKPGRWKTNLDLVRDGPLDGGRFERIRDRWRATADPSWVAQV